MLLLKVCFFLLLLNGLFTSKFFLFRFESFLKILQQQKRSLFLLLFCWYVALLQRNHSLQKKMGSLCMCGNVQIQKKLGFPKWRKDLSCCSKKWTFCRGLTTYFPFIVLYVVIKLENQIAILFSFIFQSSDFFFQFSKSLVVLWIEKLYNLPLLTPRSCILCLFSLRHSSFSVCNSLFKSATSRFNPQIQHKSHINGNTNFWKNKRFSDSFASCPTYHQ